MCVCVCVCVCVGGKARQPDGRAMDPRPPQENIRPNRRATPQNARTITNASGAPPPAGGGGGGGDETHAGGAAKKKRGHFAAVLALSV